MIERITSHQNRWVKLTASLKHKKYRDETGLFVAEGVRLVEEAVQSDWEIEACLFSVSVLASERGGKLIAELEIRGSKLFEVSEEIFNKLSDTENPQGILTLIRKKTYMLEDVMAASEAALIIVLENIQDPGNVGALLRTADAAGCSGAVLTKGCADIFGGKTVRSSMGSMFHMPIATAVESAELLTALKQRGILLLATSLATRNLYYNVDMKRPAAIVFGNEGGGVREDILRAADELMYIPIYGKAESLNVAASAAVILFEAGRQRRISL
ncbi:MAG: RNA methyltransferase [Negativicutes bacterium]|nr:RNA methyltransferase [Negativicutes bacterium]